MLTFTQFLNESLILEFLEPKSENGKFTDEEHKTATDKLEALPVVPRDQIFFKNPDKEEVFLTDVGFKDHGRVYHLDEPTRDLLTRVKINLKGVGKGQPTAQKEGIQRAIDIAHEVDTNREEKVPLLVKEGGTCYTQDGHHRICAHLLAGRPSMVVDLVEKKGNEFFKPQKEERVE